MLTNPDVGWALAALAIAIGYGQWGWSGVVLAFTMIVFWLLLQFSRALRVLRNAGQAPVGQVPNAVMLAIQSSLRGKPLPRGFLAFGEVGLAGEVRPAPRGQERLREAAKLGFAVAVVPKANAPKASDARAFEGLTIHAVERIEQAIDVVRSL